MNNLIIDLHGLTEQEAIGQIMSALISLELEECEEIEFITGKGHVLTRVVEELVEEHNMNYYRDQKHGGSYKVTL